MSEEVNEILFGEDEKSVESVEFDNSSSDEWDDESQLSDKLSNSEGEYGGEEGEEEEEREEGEEEEEEYMDDLPTWACAYCQNSDPKSVAMCATCGKWFCNSFHKTGSHIYKHMAISEHFSIYLHPHGLYPQFSDTPISCFNNASHTHVFSLGIIQHKQGYYSIICSQCCTDKAGLAELGWDAESRQCIIMNRQIANFIVQDSQNGTVQRVTDDEIYGLEKMWKTDSDITLVDYRTQSYMQNVTLTEIPTTFANFSEYKSVFLPVIEAEENSDKEENELKCIEDVMLRWENGVGNTKIAVFRVDMYDNRTRMSIGQFINLCLPVNLLNTKDENVYRGKVIQVKNDEVYIQMVDNDDLPLSYTRGFRVTFCWNGVVYDRMKEAIQNLNYEDSMSPYLFDTIMGKLTKPKPSPPLNLKSYTVPGMPELNHSQVTAVKAALENPLTLIQGPPGTGKTWTSSTILYHLVRGYKQRVLVCAPSNVAADNLTMMIHKMKLNVVRVMAVTHESIPSIVDDFCLHKLIPQLYKTDPEFTRLHQLLEESGQLTRKERAQYERLKGKAEAAILNNADVICCTCTVGGDPRITKLHCSTVLIDETTQAREPECLIPIVNGCQRLILVGDHEQLGPVIHNYKVRCAGFGISLFERLIAVGVVPYRLNVQYRMHPSLSEFPSNVFYNGDLQNGINIAERTRNLNFPWPRMDKPMMFWAVNSSEDPGLYGRSVQNRMETNCVVAVVQKLISCGISGSRIATITPYDSQRTLIRQTLYQNSQTYHGECMKVEVATVDEFQGREKDYIIFSCVRSNSNQEIGFLSDYRRMNVALTRAKYGMIIIGNPNTLKADKLWCGLLNFYQQHKCLVNGASLDSLSLYLIKIPTVMDFSDITDRYNLAKRSRMLMEEYEFAGRQEKEEEEREKEDGLKDVYSNVTTADIMGGADVSVDLGDTGL